MRRDVNALGNAPDPIRKAVGLPLGTEGEFYVNDANESILDHNQQSVTQPGLWCQWEPTDDGCGIQWDEGEKFYCYVEWLEYIVENFLKPWGYKLNGLVEWDGEGHGDVGVIRVVDNVVTEHERKFKEDFVTKESDNMKHTHFFHAEIMTKENKTNDKFDCKKIDRSNYIK